MPCSVCGFAPLRHAGATRVARLARLARPSTCPSQRGGSGCRAWGGASCSCVMCISPGTAHADRRCSWLRPGLLCCPLTVAVAFGCQWRQRRGGRPSGVAEAPHTGAPAPSSSPPPPLPAETRGLGLLRLLPGVGARAQLPRERSPEEHRTKSAASASQTRSVANALALKCRAALSCADPRTQTGQTRHRGAGETAPAPSARKPAVSPSGRWPAEVTRAASDRSHAPPVFRADTDAQVRRSGASLGSDGRPTRGCRPGGPRRGRPRADDSSPQRSSDFPELFSQPESYSLSRKRETRFPGPARR